MPKVLREMWIARNSEARAQSIFSAQYKQRATFDERAIQKAAQLLKARNVSLSIKICDKIPIQINTPTTLWKTLVEHW